MPFPNCFHNTVFVLLNCVSFSFVDMSGVEFIPDSNVSVLMLHQGPSHIEIRSVSLDFELHFDALRHLSVYNFARAFL